MGAAFDQDTALSGRTDPGCDCDWGRHDQRTGRCGDQKHDTADCELVKRDAEKCRDDDDDKGCKEHGRRIFLPELLDKKLGLSFLFVGFFHEIDDLCKRVVLKRCRSPDFENAFPVNGRGVDVSPFAFFNRDRFPGDSGFVDARSSLDNNPVGRDAGAGPDQEDVPDTDFRCRDGDLAAVFQQHCFFWRKVKERPDGGPGPCVGEFLNSFSSRVQDHQQRSFIPEVEHDTAKGSCDHENFNTDLVVFDEIFDSFTRPVVRADQDRCNKKDILGQLRDEAKMAQCQPGGGDYTGNNCIPQGRVAVPRTVICPVIAFVRAFSRTSMTHFLSPKKL